jgi:hypothetical protein
VHPLVKPAGVAELPVTAAFCDPPVVEDDDLVYLVEAVELVGDEQDCAPFSGVQQVGGKRPAAVRVKVGGGLIEDQQCRVGQERTG